MRAFVAALAIALAAVFSLAPASQAQEPMMSTAEQAEQRLTLEMATNLIRYGEARQDALALITGAKLMASVPGGVNSAEDAGIDLNAVLQAAADLGGDSTAIATLVAEVQASIEEAERAICYWQWYCYWNGYCEYWWVCF